MAAGWWELFERRAAASPSDTGLVADGVAWSFRELDRWSNRLGHLLRSAGAAPGTVVACAMSRSVCAVLALLAAAKTGATYLALDPSLPRARREVILADARPAVLLTDLTDLTEAPGVGERITLDAERWRADLAGYRPEPLCQAAEGAAYLVYTSGSTGLPKGVLVGNASLVNLYRELSARFFPLAAPGSRVAHGQPLAFDASFDPLLWLVGGYEVHLIPEEVRGDPDRYLGFLRESRMPVVEVGPAFVAALADRGLLAEDTRPGLLLMGGEAVGRSLWSRLRAVPGMTAVNLYGPTECTVFTTSCRLAECADPAIGRPIRHTRAQVVDADLRPVPDGEPGELLVGGACLAIGYLNRPELTANRFVERSGRWYRTGDLCRRRTDGRLEWLGRADDQVKIRGYRVEPGDAEHALLGLPGVRQAVVRAEGVGRDLRLVAYVVLAPGVCGLRDRLREVLPEYLLPSRIVPLEAMPLGRNGKIDRAALPSVPIRPRGPAEHLTPAQQLVAAAYQAVLGVRAVNAQADFFELGGHSLLAAAVAARLRADGVPCSLRDVLRHPTVGQLAQLVSARRRETVKEP
ncbi:amino acid adenylation domain-containing protein [Amycolatopsis anabasis]|uniref:amino acid adenylation domain-containing protein n=1 Tax=Amycolatopsis anabasis TaxID=1840409 RepID=UPI00131B492E|nr:amino acid adenylation domain-containing protein [Amycolatopsis anabasis]